VALPASSTIPRRRVTPKLRCTGASRAPRTYVRVDSRCVVGDHFGVECSGCGERSRIEAPVPDVRARVAAIELLLREGLGRPATAEEVRPQRMPSHVGAVEELSWEEMQALFAATYVDEIRAVQRDGGSALVRKKVAALSTSERRVLREALDELELV
jgi:hypothetical protein